MTVKEGSLAGKFALVSGSSLGLGAAIARELFRRGASVAINYPYPSEKANAEKVLQDLSAPNQLSVAFEADLSTEDGPRILADAAGQTFGQIDILVNCVGINRPMSLDDPDEEKVKATWNNIINLNARGTFFLTRAVLKYLSRKHSRIVNIGSTISRRPDPDSSMYAGSKGLVESYTQCWAAELPRKYGCTVNGVAPGVVGTETLLAAPQELKDALKPMIDATPVGPRMANPEEVAWAVATFCEEGASWINGVYMAVNGGSFMF